MIYKVTNPATRATVHDMLNKLDIKQPWSVEVKPWQDKRTNAQNAHYWNIVTPMVAEHLSQKHNFPYTKNMAHELLKSEFLPTHKDPVTGRVFYGSTTALKKSGDTDDTWQVYLEKIHQWAAFGGLVIPDPIPGEES